MQQPTRILPTLAALPTLFRHCAGRWVLVVSLLVASGVSAGCANALGRLGVHVPIGGFGGVSVGVNTNGSLSGTVGVGASKGGVSVGVSTSGSTSIESD